MASIAGAPPTPPTTPPDSRQDGARRRLAVAAEPTPRRPDEPELPTVGRDSYEVAGKFAQGGIGRILKARDPILGRTVALKELLVAGHALDEERFIREVLLTARLQHPGIVPVYAAGRWPSGEPFYAMKLVSGRSFDRVIADARALPARLALLPHVLAIAETVAYAHAQGIIHRDLKPGNVLVGEFGETVVIDWGLAKQIDPSASLAEPRTAAPLAGQPETRRLDPPDLARPTSSDDTPRAARRPDPSHAADTLHAPTGDDTLHASSADDTLHAARERQPGLAAPDPAGPPADPALDTRREPDADRPVARVDDLSPRPGSAPHRTPTTNQLTHVGAVVGTPGYMSPEQADGAETDARTDVFALGAILYHTLTGRLPYDADGVAAMLFKTVYEDPVPLHTRDPEIPDELAAIVDKAMARAPAARYPTARAFADDLRRFQTGQIVGAHRYTAWELIVRLVKRYRTTLTIAAAALAVIVVVVVLSFREVREERDKAVAARAEAVSRLDTISFEYARQRASDDPAAAIDLLAGLSPNADWRRIRQVAAEVDARGLPRVFHGHTAAVSRAVFSPDSTRLATTSDDCTLRVWDLSSGTSRAYHGHTDEVWRATWSPDLRRVATSSRDRSVRVWDVASGEVQVLRGHAAGVRNIAFSSDGRTLYSADDDEFLRRWDLDSGAGEVIDRCGANNVPWTESVIGCIAPRAVILHDLRTGQRSRILTDDVPLNYNGAVSPDGRFVAAGTFDRSVWLYDRDSASARLLEWPGHLKNAAVNNREMRFAPDSRHLAVPLRNTWLGLWDLADDRVALHQPHASYTRRTAFSADGELLASVGGDSSVHVIDRASASERVLVGTRAFLIDTQFSRDGRHLAGVGNDPRVFVWSDDSFRPDMWRIAPGPSVSSEAPAHDLMAIASGTAIAVVDERTLKPVARMTAAEPVVTIGLRPDASELYTLDVAGDLHVWHPRTGAHLRKHHAVPPGPDCLLATTPAPHPVVLTCANDYRAHRIDPATAAPSPLAVQIHTATVARLGDRTVVALGGEDGRLGLWDPVTDRVDALHVYDNWVRTIAVAPGDRIVVATERSLEVWDLDTRTRRALPEHPLQVNGVVVSADGRRVATSSRDNLLRVFDLESGALLHVLSPEQIVDRTFALTPDGESLAITLEGGHVLVWDLGSSHPGEARRLSGVTGTLHQIRFTPDARTIVGVSIDGFVLRWDDDLPRDPAGIRRWVDEHHDPHAADAVLVPGCAPTP
ncbi:MAG: protein kinase [Myxococcales bacterium]|nr:protein kinase [Myxococcales bacterium]